MQCRSSQCVASSGGRSAYTLFEIVIVLSVLAVLIGVSWPAVLQYAGEQELRDAAEAVRSSAASARIKAIDTGLRYQFRFEPGGQRYIVIPADSPDMLGPNTAQTDPATGGNSQYPLLSGIIPESCQFVDPNERIGTLPATEQLAADWFTYLPDSFELSATAWSPPVTFYPDGTATDGWFFIDDDRRHRIDITIRSLTGTATSGRLQREVEP